MESLRYWVEDTLHEMPKASCTPCTACTNKHFDGKRPGIISIRISARLNDHLSICRSTWMNHGYAIIITAIFVPLFFISSSTAMWASNSFAPFDPFTHNTYLFHYNILLWFATTFGFLSSCRWRPHAPHYIFGEEFFLSYINYSKKLLSSSIRLRSPVSIRRDVCRTTYRKYRTCNDDYDDADRTNSGNLILTISMFAVCHRRPPERTTATPVLL